MTDPAFVTHADHSRLAAPTSSPCVLGGDWNLKPSDAAYALLTTGGMRNRTESGAPPVVSSA